MVKSLVAKILEMILQLKLRRLIDRKSEKAYGEFNLGIKAKKKGVAGRKEMGNNFNTIMANYVPS